MTTDAVSSRRRFSGSTALAAAAALLAASMPLAAEADAELTLRDMLSDERAPEAAAALAIEGPAASLAALARGERFPPACATPVLQAMSASAGSSLAGRIRTAAAAPPALEAPRRATLPGARASIHYSGSPLAFGAPVADRDRNGHPDLVDRVAESLAAALSFLVTRHGYPHPADGGGPIDLYLAPIGHGVEGYAIAERRGRGDVAGVRIAIDAGLSDDRMMAAVLHQAAHASLLRLAPDAAPWWAEATAGFLEVTATGDTSGAGRALAARLEAPDRPLAGDGLLLMRGGLLWPLFLAERTGDPSIVRQVWNEMAIENVDALEAQRRTLARSAGMTLDDAFREYAGWNLFTGERDDGRHYSIGDRLPAGRLLALDGGLPFQIDPIDAIGSLGSLSFRIPGDGRRGSLRLEIAADGGRPAADLLAAYRSGGPDPVLVPVPLDASGSGRVVLPWSDALEIWIVLRNSAAGSGEEARFQVRGRHDPYAPFDLASFVARPLGSALQLEWTTASEDGLMGWNVHRSTAPGGPYHRLNSVAIPAFGDSSSEIGYIFVDGDASPDRRYYYLLEGLTTLGLTERSPVISGRIPPRR